MLNCKAPVGLIARSLRKASYSRRAAHALAGRTLDDWESALIEVAALSL